MLNDKQQCFYDDNVYWEMARKYDIENKMKIFFNTKYAKEHKLTYVCWQGEICGPKIQKNPHHLSENHLFCFHMIDSAHGKFDMRDARDIWTNLDMEVVPIVNENYIMPDDFDEFKKSADGFHSSKVTGGRDDCPREGYVYYKTTDPNFSFKNVSNKFLLSKNK
jgi:hypothetical protein